MSEADKRPPLQGVSRVEGLAGDTVGGGVGGKLEEETPVRDPGPPCRQAVQPGGARLPLHYGSGKAGPN